MRRTRLSRFVDGVLALCVSSLLQTARAMAMGDEPCPGDCNADGEVTVDELVLAVNVALELANPESCPAADRDGDRNVTVNEVIAGVRAALNGCADSTPLVTPHTSPTWSATATSAAVASPTAPPGEASATAGWRASPTGTASYRPASPTTTADVPTVGTQSAAPTATPTSTIAPVWRFRDVTEEAGLSFLQYRVPVLPSFFDWSYYTGGAAAGDFDGDGRVDLAATRYEPPAVLLFRNQGDGTFAEVGAAAGVELGGFHPNGVAWGDIDNDGDLDLYVTTVGHEARRFLLFVNDGRGHFTEEGQARGAAVESEFSHLGFSAAFGDYDRDGYLDIYVAEWKPMIYNRERAPGHSRLLRNRGAVAPGTFDDVTASAGVSMDTILPTCRDYGCGAAFAPRFADLDDDGWPDLLVVSDFGTSRLFWNNGDGTFSDGTAAAGVGSDENGMGSAVGDFDGDGRLDWFVTSIWEHGDVCENRKRCGWSRSGNRLYRNAGGRVFEDWTDRIGVRDSGWGWATTFADFDNDGDLDLIATNGIRLPYLDWLGLDSLDDEFEMDPVRLWLNDGAHWRNVAPDLGIADPRAGKGLLVFDYDDDGDLDVFIVNNADRPALYRNDGANRQAWLRVRLIGTSSNRTAAGARLLLWKHADEPAQVRELMVGNNFLGQDETTQHFGLGDHAGPVARLEVIWPRSGQRQVLTEITPRTTLTLVEP